MIVDQVQAVRTSYRCERCIVVERTVFVATVYAINSQSCAVTVTQTTATRKCFALDALNVGNVDWFQKDRAQNHTPCDRLSLLMDWADFRIFFVWPRFRHRDLGGHLAEIV